MILNRNHTTNENKNIVYTYLSELDRFFSKWSSSHIDGIVQVQVPYKTMGAHPIPTLYNMVLRMHLEFKYPPRRQKQIDNQNERANEWKKIN